MTRSIPYAAILATLGTHERDAILAFLASTKLDPLDACSHGALELPQLVRMLLQDLALAVLRPGSWEGDNMRQVLASHGYTTHRTDPACLATRSAYWGGKDPY